MKIVWYSEIKWDYLKTRKQHLLSHFPAEDRILFFQPFSFKGSNSFSPKTDGNVTYVTLPVYRKTRYKTLNNIFQYRIVRVPFYLIIRFWGAILRLIIVRGCADKYVFSNIFALPLKKRSCVSFWDYNDDPEQFGPQPKWAMQLFEEYLYDPEQTVVACSQYLTRELNAKYKRKVIHIPNGVDLSVFADYQSTIPLIERRILGYVGVISPWFFDFELVEIIAKSYPGFGLHLYGPVDRDADKQLQELIRIKNIKYFPAIDYSQLPIIMGSFRVGLIPLKSMPKVWQAASAKYLQYLAAGIPVVSTYMEQFAGLSGRAFMGKSHQDILIGIQNALEFETLQELASLRAYDWESLSHQFRNTISDSH